MDISSVLPSYNSKEISATAKTATANAVADYGGPSFMDVVRSANILIANGASNAMPQFNARKEDKPVDPFSFSEAEEELLEEYLVRIKKMMEEMGK